MNTPNRAAETLPNVQEPNPYRATVQVEHDPDASWCAYVDLVTQYGSVDSIFMAEFPTKEEADTHAALILAALHQAVIE